MTGAHSKTEPDSEAQLDSILTDRRRMILVAAIRLKQDRLTLSKAKWLTLVERDHLLNGNQ